MSQGSSPSSPPSPTLVAQAQVRARVYADEHALAAVLQRAIMPVAAAVIPGLEIGADYRQAGTARQVGGDWYDAMASCRASAPTWLSATWSGTAWTAAEDMTQLRNAGRTLAIAGYQPASILEELARVTDWATSGKFATVAAAIIEPDVSLITYATAGHPPILIRRAKTGTVEIPRPPRGQPCASRSGQGLVGSTPRARRKFRRRRHHAHVHRRADRGGAARISPKA